MLAIAPLLSLGYAIEFSSSACVVPQPVRIQTTFVHISFFDFIHADCIETNEGTEQFARFWNPAGNSFWLFAKSPTKRHDNTPFG
jgi:hypothetical protein